MVEVSDFRPNPIERIASIVLLNVEQKEVAQLREVHRLATIEKFKRDQAQRAKRHSKSDPLGPSLFDEELAILNVEVWGKPLE